MKISIAMATFNGAKYLPEQLDSFVQQTRLPDELVVTDDGSTDATLDMLEAFRVRAPFDIRIHRNDETLGYALNFERALSLCTGDLVLLSDQDDFWFPDKVERIEAVFRLNPDIYVVQVDLVLADEELRPTPYTQLEQLRALGYPDESFISGCGTAMRTEWLKLAFPMPRGIEMGHDYWIHRLAVPLGVRELIEDPLQYYRRHETNASQWIASNTNRVRSIDSVFRHGLRAASAGWHAEVKRLEAAKERIEANQALLGDWGLDGGVQAAGRSLAKRIEALKDRLEIAELPRWKRWPRVLASYADGTYGHFQGWKSVAKDLIRP